MVRPMRDKLKGEIEVDETYIGGVEIGNTNNGRGAETKISTNFQHIGVSYFLG